MTVKKKFKEDWEQGQGQGQGPDEGNNSCPSHSLTSLLASRVVMIVKVE